MNTTDNVLITNGMDIRFFGNSSPTAAAIVIPADLAAGSIRKDPAFPKESPTLNEGILGNKLGGGIGGGVAPVPPGGVAPVPPGGVGFGGSGRAPGVTVVLIPIV